MSEDNVQDAYVITDAQPGASESEAPKPPTIRFGFVVLVDTEGTMYIERNKSAIAGIDVERDATLVEVRRYCQEVIFDLAAQASAEYTSLRMSAQAKE
jgi:hypothetical protein